MTCHKLSGIEKPCAQEVYHDFSSKIFRRTVPKLSVAKSFCCLWVFGCVWHGLDFYSLEVAGESN